MAGINRLGKGNAKPGTLRPADPNRFKTEDFFSVDAEQDPEYIRRIMEVEQLAVNKTGSVMAKGAFDKNDALFMRDHTERMRHQELERRDAELANFSRVRLQVEQDSTDIGRGPPLKRPKSTRSKIAVRRVLDRPAEKETEASEAGVGTSRTAADVRTNPQDELGNQPESGSAPSEQMTGVNHSQLPGGEVATLVTSEDVAGGQTVLCLGSVPNTSTALGLMYGSGESSDSSGGSET